MSELIRTKAEVFASAEDLTDTVEVTDRWHPRVRALNDAEFNRAQARLLEGQELKTSSREIEIGRAGDEISLSLGGLIEAEFSARVYICSKGLIEDDWSEDEVRSIPFNGAVEVISQKILDLGGHDLMEGLNKGARQNVSRFRPDGAGAGDSGSSADGDTVGEVSGGDDNTSEGIPEGSDASGVATAAGE